jgi:hypothetical protein
MTSEAIIPLYNGKSTYTQKINTLINSKKKRKKKKREEVIAFGQRGWPNRHRPFGSGSV